MRHDISRGTDSRQNCETWGLIQSDMLNHILLHLTILVNNHEANEKFKKLQRSSNVILSYEHYIHALISCSLKLASEEPINRQNRQLIFAKVYAEDFSFLVQFNWPYIKLGQIRFLLV